MSGRVLLCPCEFFVPTAHNDGRPVAAETILRIHSALIRQFEALTVLGPVTGEWRKQVEQHAWFMVAVPENRVDEVKALVMKIGKELGQKQMYFKAGPPSVDLIDIEDDTPPLSDAG